MSVRPRKPSAEGRSELCRPGDVFGRYEVLFPIASGGMAIVYAARTRGEGRFQKPVAIKLMLPHLTRDERFSSMFMDEATLAANIQSPHVVSTLDLGREGDVLYMAMDLVLGPTLRELHDAGRIPPPVAASILVQTARGLHDAHQARSVSGELLRLVHRDVSPHNVLVGVDGRARLSDFGVARAIHRHSHTETGELKGKLAYFSPEQLEARDDLDHRSDVFALGVVAWETFAGERLFAAPNPLALAKLIASKEIARLDEHAALPEEVADVVDRALKRDPNDRFPTAEAFGEALERAARATFGVVSTTEVGALVRELGGERVRSLERRIQRLMTAGAPSGTFEITGPVAAVDVPEPTPVIPELAPSNDAPRPTRSRARALVVLALIGVVTVAVAWVARRAAAPDDEARAGESTSRPEAVDDPAGATSSATAAARNAWIPDGTEGSAPSPMTALLEQAPSPAPEAEVTPASAPVRTRRSTPSRMTATRRERPTSTVSATSPTETSAPRGASETMRTSMTVLRVGLERFEGSLDREP